MELIFDIETAREFNQYSDCDPIIQACWSRVGLRKYPNLSLEDSYKQFAGLHPEFCRIVCIVTKGIGENAHVFHGIDEAAVLRVFFFFLGKCKALSDELTLIGHGIMNFDVPVVRVRSAKNGLELPNIFKAHSRSADFIDTRNAWLGDNFNSTQVSNLETICTVLQIATPKDGLQAHEVSDHYWSARPDAVGDICEYCEKDVIATEACYLKMKRLNLI